MRPVFLERKFIIFACVVVAASFILGIIIGYFSKSSSENESKLKSGHDILDFVKKAHKKLNAEQIRTYHKFLTKEPHIAGLKRDNELTDWIKEEWESHGLDKVTLAEYNFYLSWPDPEKPNKIHLIDENAKVQFTSQHKEKELREGDAHDNFVDAFLAYTPNATVEGQLVYINYGRVEDFRELEDKHGQDFINGTICMMRYGKIFRGNKVKNCQDRGGIGVILYSDPAEVALNGTKSEDVYPNTIFLPGSGVQRGSAFLGDGDPLSPGWPSIENAFRLKDRSEVDSLPKIPGQPIGYDDAKVLLEKMGGPDPISDKWKGKLNVTYQVGGEFKAPWSNWKVKLSTHNYEKTVKSSNVFGIIEGSVEKDRYVIMSNHRDAWGYGSADPSSGTAQLMELVRVFGELKKEGWSPRRTIIFASWAAEESGLEGSIEWADEHHTKLQQRVVGLVNTDICTTGPIAKSSSSAVLEDVVVNAYKAASDPTGEHPSYYDFLKKWTNQDNNGTEKEVKIKLLGSGSDHAPFAFILGIPAMSIAFYDDDKKYKGLGFYPMYHTGYETFYMMDKIIDPGYKITKTCAETSLYSLLSLADSAILPYNLRSFSKAVNNALEELDEELDSKNIASLFEKNGVTLKHVKSSAKVLDSKLSSLMDKIESGENEIMTNPIKQRMMNDLLMQLEKVFLMTGELPTSTEFRHAIFAPGIFDAYGGKGFPILKDLLHNIDRVKEGDPEYTERWQAVKKHVSLIMIMMQSAVKYSSMTDELDD